MAEVNLDPDIGQSASFKEISIPLADPVEWEEGMLCPATLGAEQRQGDVVMASLCAISIAQAAHVVRRWGLLLYEDV
jgi:hypothetical protein